MVMVVVVHHHRSVLWLESLTELLAMMDWLVGSLETWLWKMVVVIGHYLDQREPRVVMVNLVHHHTQYSLVAHGHPHGGPDQALVLGSGDSSLVQHHCWTSARHDLGNMSRHAPCLGAYHQLEQHGL
jgi:hypothetical protein